MGARIVQVRIVDGATYPTCNLFAFLRVVDQGADPSTHYPFKDFNSGWSGLRRCKDDMWYSVLTAFLEIIPIRQNNMQDWYCLGFRKALKFLRNAD